jgi:hypothetical protein
VAIEALQSKFPGITIKSGNEIGDKDDMFWATYIKDGPEPISLADLIESLLGDVLQGVARKNVKLTLISEEAASSSTRKGIRIVADGTYPVSDQDKRAFGLTQAYLADDGHPKVHLETVVAPHRGREFVRSDLALAKRINAHEFTLTASAAAGTNEGIFAWARYGFIPTEKWDAMRRWGLDRLAKGDVPLSDTLKEILLDPAPVALRRLVYLSWVKNSKEITAFLNGVLAADMGWKGRLDLTDATSVTWIATYINSTKAREHLDVFAKLLPAPSSQHVPPPESAKPTAEPTENTDITSMLNDDEMAQILVGNIQEGNVTLDEVRAQFGSTKPSIVAKVQAALQSKT